MTVPVIALTGYLGAGKTSLLNHLLRRSGARIGVVVNDFGAINVDAALVRGQVDDPAAFTGGCLCCLADDDGLDGALERLAHPRLALDAILVEASGLADPLALGRMIRFSGAPGIRPGGVVDVVDAANLAAVDRGGEPPERYAAASLVVVNKIDQVADPDEAVAAVAARVRGRNPRGHVVGAVQGRIDPTLLHDVARTDPPDELPLWEVVDAHPADHTHARAVTVTGDGPVDPGRVVDLLEDPPPGAYRLKGTVGVTSGGRQRAYTVNLVGRSIHVATAPVPAPTELGLVAIGVHLDTDEARRRLDRAMEPADGPTAAGLRRLQRYRRLSR